MNRLAQFLHYAHKVFALKTLLRGIRDERPWAEIPTLPIALSLVLGVVVRSPSHHDLAHQTTRRRWRHLCGLKRALSHDTFAYATERLNLADLRHNQAEVVKALKANKALESCKINGLLCLSLDANEHFASRSRCCEACCQRTLEVADDQGHPHEVIEYYHRYVFAQINGPKLNALLDLEPIRPGEDECAAALRLLGRLRRTFGPRFFDLVTVDAWYARGPFLRALDKLGWLWVVVLKRPDMEIYQEALQLSQGAPDAAFEDEPRHRQVQLWEVKDLRFSDGYTQPVRVVRAAEHWVEQRIQGGKKQAQPKESQWLWVACERLASYDARVIYQAGHRRWGIENKAFNELTQAYHLEHCYHHHPRAMLAQMLILLLGFTLFTAFAQLHSPLLRLGRLTAKALAKELDLALEADLDWGQWFQSG